MKILLVSNMYPSARYPHYGVFVENTEKVLTQLPGVKLGKAVLQKQDGRPAKLIGYLSFYGKILAKGIFGGYDIIYGHFLSHISLPLRIVKALNPRVKLVLNAHGNDVIADTEKDHKWVAQSRKLTPLADHIIVPSGYFKALLQDDFDVPAEKLLVYPSGGVNTNVFSPADRQTCAAALGLDPEKRYIGYVSRLEPDKGWDTFLPMAAALQDRTDLEFIVVGDGAEKDAFAALAEKLGLSRRLIRYPLLSQQDICKIFSLLEVFCFPTRRKSESLGLVGLEAMACGCKVVASNAGGPASYMQDGVNGFVFDPANPEELTEKVLLAMETDKEVLLPGMQATIDRYCNRAVDGILLDFFAEMTQNN